MKFKNKKHRQAVMAELQKKQLLERIENRISKSNKKYITPKNEKPIFYPAYKEHPEWQPNPNDIIKIKTKPSTFLYLTKADEGINIFRTDDIDTITKLRKRIHDGKPIRTPELDIDLTNKQVFAHDGRHRALSAMHEGVKIIPVNATALNCKSDNCDVISPDDLKREQLKLIMNLSKLKPQPDKNFDMNSL